MRETHSVEVGHLQEALRREEQRSMELKAALTLKENRQKKGEDEVGLERERAIESFKSSKAMEDIKVTFAQEAFLKGFKLCQRRMTEKFFELDLSFLMGESFDDEAGPYTTTTNLLSASLSLQLLSLLEILRPSKPC